MKVNKSYLGKRVEVIWRDPCSAHIKSHDLKNYADVPKGREVLAYQEEQGVIDDVTDGVVRIRHTKGLDSPIVPDQSADLYYTWVDENLIEKITVFEPSTKEDDNGPRQGT
jgi:hypothetical protein